MNDVVIIGDAERAAAILSALAHTCGLNAVTIQAANSRVHSGYIILGDAEAPSEYRNYPFIRVKFSDSCSIATLVRFGRGPSSPFPFIGRTLQTHAAIRSDEGSEHSGEVIAAICDRPVWISNIDHRGRCDTCWVSKAWVEKGDSVFDHLNGARFMNLLPILEWLRWISGWKNWHQPPHSISGTA